MTVACVAYRGHAVAEIFTPVKAELAGMDPRFRGNEEAGS